MALKQFKFKQLSIYVTLSLFVIFFFQQVHSQKVAINDNGALPDNSSVLDVNSTTGGLLIPRFATNDLGNINAPIANGLMIFNTTTSSFQFYDINTSAWKDVGSNAVKPSGINGSVQFNSNGTFGNSNKLFWDNANNNFGIGTNMPNATLDVNGDIMAHGITVGLGKGAYITNTALGINCLKNITSGEQNVAMGLHALIYNENGMANTAIGYQTLATNKSGSNNTANGALALYSNIDGSSNTVLGYMSMYLNKSGNNNTAVGNMSLFSLDGGLSNTTIGTMSGFNLTTGGDNTIVGYNSGMGLQTGSGNTIIGASVSGLDPALSNNIIIADGNGTRRINVNASGYVGIGTNTPSKLLDVNGEVIIADKLNIGTGINKSMGTATLVAGTITINTTTVKTGSKIFITRNTPGGTLGNLSVPDASIINGVSFVINSDNNAETSTVNWWIIN